MLNKYLSLISGVLIFNEYVSSFSAQIKKDVIILKVKYLFSSKPLW